MFESDIDIITAAATHDLISLADLKIMLDIPAADTSSDQQLQMLIEQNSHAIARECNRIFGKEEVTEYWDCFAPMCCPDGAARLWLSHYPVESIVSIETPTGTLLDPIDYRLEKLTGKLTIEGAWGMPVIVTYIGGYNLPDEAPPELQAVASNMVRSSRTEAAAASTGGSGIRMLAHKESRVIYFSPKDMAGGTAGGTSVAPSNTSQFNKNMLSKFTRYFI